MQTCNLSHHSDRENHEFLFLWRRTWFFPVRRESHLSWPSDWIEQCFTSPPTQYRLCGRRFLQVKRPNQQYQSTEGTNSTQKNQTYNKQTWTQNTASPLAYSNMGWLGDGSHRGQGCQAWSAVGLPPRRRGTPSWPSTSLSIRDAWQSRQLVIRSES